MMFDQEPLRSSGAALSATPLKNRLVPFTISLGILAISWPILSSLKVQVAFVQPLLSFFGNLLLFKETFSILPDQPPLFPHSTL